MYFFRDFRWPFIFLDLGNIFPRSRKYFVYNYWRTSLQADSYGNENLYENGPNPFFLFGIKNMVRVKLMATVLFRHGFDYY